MRQIAQTNARVMQTLHIFYFSLSAFGGHV